MPGKRETLKTEGLRKLYGGIIAGAAIAFLITVGGAFALPSSGAGAQGAGPNLFRYPFLQQMTTNSVLIVWATDKDGSSEVHYGVGALSSVAAASSDRVDEPAIPGPTPSSPGTPTPTPEPSHTYYIHVAHLLGLQPGTAYNYTVLTSGFDMTGADSLSFRTAPGPAASSIRVLVFGDSGTGTASQLRLRNAMLNRSFDLALHTGDVVYPHGTYHELITKFFAVYQNVASRVPFFLSMGNHDYETMNGQPYLDDFYLPENATPASARERYYSFDYGPAHFVALDTEIVSRYQQDPTAAQDMLDWLSADLAATQQPWKIVFLHKPPYSSSNVPVNANLALLPPIFEQQHVNVVLTGHDHLYTHTLPIKNGTPQTILSGGIPYITTGGGSEPGHLCQPRSYTAICLRATHFLDVTITQCLFAYDAVGFEGALVDHFEVNRCNPDSNNNGIPDSTDPNPLADDADGDGLPDATEINVYHTDPHNPDTDGDGLSDGLEVSFFHTDPLNPDTDGDGYPDGVEVLFGSNPLDPRSTPVLPTATPTHTGTPTPSATPTRTPTPTSAGDVNCDGQTNSIDAALVLQHSAGLLPTIPCPQNADVNRDGDVNAIDAAVILQYSAGLIHALPV